MIRDQETLEALLDSVRRFVRERLVPAENEVAETDEIPESIVQEMRNLGLFGMTIPEQFGGLELTMEEEVRVLFELCQTAPAFRSVIGTTVGIGSQGILIDGTPEQQAAWLPKLATGEIMASFALTEPEAGSDAASLRTTAIRHSDGDGDHYVVNGNKRFITNAPHAGMFTLMARTDPANKGAGGVSAFIVDAKSPGISFGKNDVKMGQKGAHTCDVFFDNVRVPAANLIGLKEGQGFKTAMKVLNKQRIHLAALCTGPAIRMLEEAMRWTTQRHQFGQPVAQFQLVQALIADCQTDIQAARALILQTARQRDEGEDVSLQASVCKYFASEMCGRVADRCVQMLGGSGYIHGHPIERFYRDVRLFRLYEGTSQIQQIVIARNMVREARA